MGIWHSKGPGTTHSVRLGSDLKYFVTICLSPHLLLEREFSSVSCSDRFFKNEKLSKDLQAF